MTARQQPRSQIARVLVASCLAFACGCATTQATSTTKESSNKVERAASTAGMQRVPLIITAQGSALVETKVNGKEMVLLVDTGAQSTVMDVRVATEAGVKSIPLSSYSQGVGAGRIVRRQGEIITMTLPGGVDVQVRPSLQDFSVVTNSLLSRGGKPVVGLLGFDVMRAYGAIIDLNEGAMYLQKR